MIKLIGPGCSTQATGSIADVLTISKSPRSPYAKKHAKPKQPNTNLQVATHAAVKFLAQAWKTLSPADQATWEPRGKQLDLYPYHAYVSYNAERLSHFLAPSKQDPATALSAASLPTFVSIVGGRRMITLSCWDSVPADHWGYLIHRSSATPVPTTRQSVVALLDEPAWPPFVWRDTPLLPGQYWYTARTFNVDGALSNYRSCGSAWVT